MISEVFSLQRYLGDWSFIKSFLFVALDGMEGTVIWNQWIDPATSS